MGRSGDARLKEHQRYIRLEQQDKSAVGEHGVDLGNCIQFHNTSILATKTQYMDRIVRKAIEIQLHPKNMNTEMGVCLNKSLKPLICSLINPPERDARSARLRRSSMLGSLVPRLFVNAPR
jgi:hypothetical protein